MIKQKQILSLISAVTMLCTTVTGVANAQSEENQNIQNNVMQDNEERIGISFLYGDINDDGVSDLTDLSYLSLYLMKSTTFNMLQKEIADIDSNGTVDIADLAYYKQYICKDESISSKLKINDKKYFFTASVVDVSDNIIICNYNGQNKEFIFPIVSDSPDQFKVEFDKDKVLYYGDYVKVVYNGEVLDNDQIKSDCVSFFDVKESFVAEQKNFCFYASVITKGDNSILVAPKEEYAGLLEQIEVVYDTEKVDVHVKDTVKIELNGDLLEICKLSNYNPPIIHSDNVEVYSRSKVETKNSFLDSISFFANIEKINDNSIIVNVEKNDYRNPDYPEKIEIAYTGDKSDFNVGDYVAVIYNEKLSEDDIPKICDENVKISKVVSSFA